MTHIQPFLEVSPLHNLVLSSPVFVSAFAPHPYAWPTHWSQYSVCCPLFRLKWRNWHGSSFFGWQNCFWCWVCFLNGAAFIQKSSTLSLPLLCAVFSIVYWIRVAGSPSSVQFGWGCFHFYKPTSSYAGLYPYSFHRAHSSIAHCGLHRNDRLYHEHAPPYRWRRVSFQEAGCVQTGRIWPQLVICILNYSNLWRVGARPDRVLDFIS